MSNRPRVQIATIDITVEPQRRLSQELYDYLLAGQPDSELFERIGREIHGWDEFEAYFEISEGDLLDLIHARNKPVRAGDFLSLPADEEGTILDTGHFSPEMANLLPKGHPFRKHHGIVDTEFDRITWIIGDPDLSEDDRQLIRETLLEPDNESRAKAWNKLVGKNQLSEWAWFEIRGQLLRALTNPYETYLDSLHPREAGVLRFIASGFSLAQVAEKFGVDANRIKEIYLPAGEGFRAQFQEAISLLQAYIEKFQIVEIVELAGIARDMNEDFLPTRLLLKFCSGGLITSHSGKTYILSNDLKDSVVKL